MFPSDHYIQFYNNKELQVVEYDFILFGLSMGITG